MVYILMVGIYSVSFVFDAWAWPYRDRTMTVPWPYRDHTVTVPWPYRDRDFLNVLDRDLVQYDRFRPFTVPDRSPFLTVHRSWPFMIVPDRFRAFYERFRPFYVRFRSFHDRKRSENDRKRSGTLGNARERSGTIRNGQERWTVRNT